MKKKRDFDVIGILLGVVIGILIGYFISNKVILNDAPVFSGKEDEKENGYVYLLQVAKFDNPEGALNYIKNAKNNNLYFEAVADGDFYYIYGGIAINSNDLDVTKAVLVAKGYTPIVKKEYLLDKANRVLDDLVKYNFWLEGINNLLLALEGKNFSISNEYYQNPIDLEFFSTLTILQTIQNEEIKNKTKLQAYRMICENLS